MEFEEERSFKPDPVFTNSRPKWVDDSNVHKRCGLVFCQKCSSNNVKIPQLNYNFVPVRVCDECYRMVSM
eukprot:gene1345-1699_t